MIETRPTNLTSDAGAIAIREVAERLGVLDWLERRIDDTRVQEYVTHKLKELLATALVLLGQGYRDRDDADARRHDPAMRLAVSTRTGDAPLRSAEEHGDQGGGQIPDGLASQPTNSRLVEMLSSETNRAFLNYSLTVAAGHCIRAMNHGHRLRRVAFWSRSRTRRRGVFPAWRRHRSRRRSDGRAVQLAALLETLEQPEETAGPSPCWRPRRRKRGRRGPRRHGHRKRTVGRPTA
ncbi:MAG: hypothetical protein FJ125_05275 [Deltaproteobacteria bacterium]|nr:hypothetical protein [Deltaproteobacteria bacterium]